MTHDASPAPEGIPHLHGPPQELRRIPLIAPEHGAGWLSDKIAAIVESRPPRWWKLAFGLSLLQLAAGVMAGFWLISTGVGIWGVNHPVMWGWDIVNFVWWIGIAHAGTLISAILFLLRQRWRTSISRAAEAMTLFAVICAAIYPLIHVGRPWFNWWLLPIPNSNGVWPQFKSPLMWDVFAVSTYFVVSALFWYLGLLPDLAVMRDRSQTRARKIAYGLLALGWTGSNRHWSHYEKAYLIVAGLSTALVLSVHSIVSLDFSISILPGWHSTIFPPYFVAGAVFSGMGMVLTILIPLRRAMRIEEVITPRHIDLMCKVTLAAGCIVAYAYGVEFFTAWFSGNPDEKAAYFANRLADPFVLAPLLGIKPAPYWWACWTMLVCNVLVIQALWFRSIRANMVAVFVVAILVNVGMWFERFVIIVSSLHRDFVPSSWGHYAPSLADVLLFLGTFGLFSTLFLLFIRFFPMIAIAEVKSVANLARLPANASANRMAIPEISPGQGRYLVAEFAVPAQVLRVAVAIRRHGFEKWDVFTPFPIHGMDRAMGLSNSRLGWFAFFGGAVGFALGMLMIWWMNAVDYPILIGGKPMFSPWTALPPAFELTILGAAAGAIYGMRRFNHLPQWHNRLLKKGGIGAASHDRCCVVIDTLDSHYSRIETPALLARAGAVRMEVLEP